MNSFDKYLQSALKLGLSSKASVVYIFLLKAKKAIAPIKIILGTKLHRQYVYDAIEELKEKELIDSTGAGRGVRYFAHTPNKIIKKFEQKRLEAIDGANDLMKLFKKTSEGTIDIIEGEEAVIENEIEILKEGEKNSWLDIIGGAGTGFLELFDDRLEEYEKIRERLGCQIRYIGSSHDEKYYSNLKIKRRKLYEYRYLDNIDKVVNISIRPKTVSFNIYSPEVMVIRLNSPETVISQKALFEVLWKVAKKR